MTKSGSETVTIGILAGVCHGEKARFSVLELAVVHTNISGYVDTQLGLSTHKFSSAKRSP